MGRAGAQVTADMDLGVSVRIVAAERDRVARMMEVLDIDEKSATAGGQRRDADRARMVRSHFGIDISDPTGYDAVFNASRMSRGEIAESVVALVSHRVSG